MDLQYNTNLPLRSGGTTGVQTCHIRLRGKNQAGTFQKVYLILPRRDYSSFFTYLRISLEFVNFVIFEYVLSTNFKEGFVFNYIVLQRAFQSHDFSVLKFSYIRFFSLTFSVPKFFSLGVFSPIFVRLWHFSLGAFKFSLTKNMEKNVLGTLNNKQYLIFKWYATVGLPLQNVSLIIRTTFKRML